MRNIFRGTTTALPETTGKTVRRTPDMLDVLLRLSASEAKEVMDIIAKEKAAGKVEAPKAKNKVEAKYDISEKAPGLVFLC